MIKLKTKEDFEILRIAGKMNAEILRRVAKRVAPGVSTAFLNKYSRELIRSLGGEPSFLGYRPSGAKRPYPAALCVSVNNEVVHGIPSESRILVEGDIVSLDFGVVFRGRYTGWAIPIPVGEISEEAKLLIEAAKLSLDEGIKVARAGNFTGDIGESVSRSIKSSGSKYGIVTELCGHGVGFDVHEPPFVPNVGHKGDGEKLLTGMVIAIEPMIIIGSGSVECLSDGYTFISKEGGLAAHFEHTVFIAEDGPIVLTRE